MDYGSKAPLTMDGMEEFKTPNCDIGIKVKSRRVRCLDIKDLSLGKLAVLALNADRWSPTLKE